jgi:hypothetical protein
VPTWEEEEWVLCVGKRRGGKLRPSFDADFEFLLDGCAAASMFRADEMVSLHIPALMVVGVDDQDSGGGVDDHAVDTPAEACCRWVRPPELARSSAVGDTGEEVRSSRRGWSALLMWARRLARDRG